MIELDGNLYLVNGHKMLLSEKEGLQKRIIENGLHEWGETAWTQIIVRQGWTCIDVGGNIGYYTLLLAGLVGGKGRVVAFEPIPVSFARLKKNVELNAFTNVDLVNAAASDRNEQVRHHFNMVRADGAAPNYGGWGLGGTKVKSTDDQNASDIVDITCVTIDDYCAEHRIGRVHFMKIDVEGHELPVLRGARNVLARYKPSIMMEVTVDNRHRSNDDTREQISTLTELGYTICAIEKRPWPHIREIKQIDYSVAQHFNAFCYHGHHDVHV